MVRRRGGSGEIWGEEKERNIERREFSRKQALVLMIYPSIVSAGGIMFGFCPAVKQHLRTAPKTLKFRLTMEYTLIHHLFWKRYRIRNNLPF